MERSRPIGRVDTGKVRDDARLHPVPRGFERQGRAVRHREISWHVRDVAGGEAGLALVARGDEADLRRSAGDPGEAGQVGTATQQGRV